jgi:hypothetical protein
LYSRARKKGAGAGGGHHTRSRIVNTRKYRNKRKELDYIAVAQTQDDL